MHVHVCTEGSQSILGGGNSVSKDKKAEQSKICSEHRTHMFRNVLSRRQDTVHLKLQKDPSGLLMNNQPEIS